MSANESDGVLSSRWKPLLLTLSGASVGGIGLADDPVGFVQVVVFRAISSTALDIAAAFGVDLLAVWDDVGAALGGIAYAVSAPGAAVRELTTGLIWTVHNLAVSVALSAGPLAPIVVVLVWALTFGAIGLLIRAGLEVIKWVT